MSEQESERGIAGIETRLAVCSWSLKPESAADLTRSLEAIGCRRVQLALGPIWQKPEQWAEFEQVFSNAGITVVSGMFGAVRENYSSLATIRATGGVVPDATWEENRRNFREMLRVAARLRLRFVSLHAGFIPPDPADVIFATVKDRITEFADLASAAGLGIALETGQETAETLRRFLELLDHRNVGVNFDPANMVIYGMGDPTESLRTILPWLWQCHVKDALPSQQPGLLGPEVPVGQGVVDWKAFFSTLNNACFDGNLCIEREGGRRRVDDIRDALRFVSSMA